MTGRLPEKHLKHFLIKHKKETGGGFARWVNLKEDPQLAAAYGIERNSKGSYWLRVHTNKCEGLNSHLKHKVKRLRGTSRRNVMGYLGESVGRMNATALKMSSFEFFADLILTEPVEIREDETNSEADADWDVNFSDEEDNESQEEADNESQEDEDNGSQEEESHEVQSD